MLMVLVEANLSLVEFLWVVAALVLAVVIGIVSANRGWFEFNDKE